MKRLFVVAVALVALVGMAQAAEFTVNPNPATGPSGQSSELRAPNITQNTDPATITPANSVSCNASSLHTDNWYLRRFFLNTDHGITIQYTVTSVDLGIESSVPAAGTQPMTISLYGLAGGDALTFANLAASQIGTANFAVPAAAEVVQNFVVGGAILDPTADDLVVEVFTPEGQTDGNIFFIGSNAAGQSQPSFIAAPDCGISEPTDTADIGFANMHIVMTVNGDEAAQPTATPNPDAGGAPIPTMNRWGMLAMVGMLLGVAVLVIIRRK